MNRTFQFFKFKSKMCHGVQLLAGSLAGVTNGLDMEMETVRPSV